MRISREKIRAAVVPPATGIAYVLLAIVGFIAGLWVLAVVVRVVAG